MLTLVMEPGDLDDMIFDEYDGGPRSATILFRLP